MFWIVTCFMYPRVFTKEGSCGDCCLTCDSSFLLMDGILYCMLCVCNGAPQNIFGLGPPKALTRPCIQFKLHFWMLVYTFFRYRISRYVAILYQYLSPSVEGIIQWLSDVCVCMCEQDNSKKCGPIWIKFSGSIDFGGGRNRLDFEDSPHGEVAPWANFRLYTFTYTVRRKARKYRHGNHYGEGGLSGLYRTLHPRGRLPGRMLAPFVGLPNLAQ